MKENKYERLANDKAYRDKKIKSNAAMFFVVANFLALLLGNALYKGEISVLHVLGIFSVALVFLSLVTHESPLSTLREIPKLYILGVKSLLFIKKKQ